MSKLHLGFVINAVRFQLFTLFFRKPWVNILEVSNFYRTSTRCNLV